MGLFDFWKPKVEKRERMIDADALLAGLSTDTVTVEEALGLPVIVACCNYVAGVIASCPIRLYNDKEEIKDDYRIKLLNDDMGDLLGVSEWKRALVLDYLLRGNSYAYVDWSRNKVRSLRYIKPTYVSYTNNVDPIYKDADFFVGGSKVPNWQMFRVLRNTDDGVRGKGIVDECSALISTALAEQRLAKRIYATQGIKGYIQSRSRLTQDALNQLHHSWESMVDSNSLMVLNDGLSFQQLASEAKELELDDARSTDYKQLCTAFGVVPTVILGGASESDKKTTIDGAIAPLARAIGEALTRYLLLEKEKKSGYNFEVDLDGLECVGMAERYGAYATALSAGITTIDEIREREGLPSADIGYLKLGLDSVLYSIKDKSIYTPNTNAFVTLGDGGNAEPPKDDGEGVSEDGVEN